VQHHIHHEQHRLRQHHPLNFEVKQAASSSHTDNKSNKFLIWNSFFLFLISCCLSLTSAAITEQCLRCICQVRFCFDDQQAYDENKSNIVLPTHVSNNREQNIQTSPVLQDFVSE
jgi:hypothetical protein